MAADEHDLGLRQLGAGAFAVHVAAHRGDGSNFAQLVEHRLRPHIAQVENAFDAGQSRAELRAEESVGVTDDADFHWTSSWAKARA